MTDTPHTPPTPDTDAPAAHESVSQVFRSLGAASVLGVISLSLPAIGAFFLLRYINPVGTFFRDLGGRGPAAFVALFVLFAGLALVPTYASAIIGGWSFGFEIGYPAVMCGLLGASVLSFLIARPAAAGRVEAAFARHPRFRAVRDALLRSGAGRAFLIIMLIRLPPNSPFALSNLLLASVRVPLPIYAGATLLGLMPRTAVVVYAAARVQNKLASEITESEPWWLIAVGIAVSLACLAALGVIAARALRRVTDAHTG